MILHPFIVQHNFQPNGRLPNSKHSGVKRKSSTYNSKYDMDLDTPARIEPHGPAIIYGVESEEVEEINDAYNDMLEDLGLSKATEVEFLCRPTCFKVFGCESSPISCNVCSLVSQSVSQSVSLTN